MTRTPATAAVLFSLTLWTPSAAEGFNPTPLADTASAPARLAAPAPAPPTAPAPAPPTAPAPARPATPAPKPFELPASSAKLELAAGAKQARMEAKVAAGKPSGVLFTAPGENRMFWVGVSSPKGDVWMAAWDTRAKQWVTGTDPKTHVSRLSVSFEKPTELLLVAITDSAETPFRFEVNLGPSGL